MMNGMSWEDVGSPEGLKKTIPGIIVGILVFVVAGVVACLLSDVGNHILQAINETGITIPASANYVAPIESLVCSAFLIVRTLSGLLVVIGIILALDIVTIVALWKHYGDVYESFVGL